jgi:hypothetical protein
MILVRYATLVALVLWLAAMIDAQFGTLLGRGAALSYGCGFATIVGLFVMKFMGPPPRAFVPRAAIAGLMLLIAFASTLRPAREFSATLMVIDIGLGLALLYWYVRE